MVSAKAKGDFRFLNFHRTCRQSSLTKCEVEKFQVVELMVLSGWLVQLRWCGVLYNAERFVVRILPETYAWHVDCVKTLILKNPKIYTDIHEI